MSGRRAGTSTGRLAISKYWVNTMSRRAVALHEQAEIDRFVWADRRRKALDGGLDVDRLYWGDVSRFQSTRQYPPDGRGPVWAEARGAAVNLILAGAERALARTTQVFAACLAAI